MGIKMARTIIMDHPLIQHKIGYIRRIETGTKDFRQTIGEIAMLICYEATRDLKLGDVEIDVDARRVTRGGSPIPLTSKEFDLMLLFVENRNIALFRENLYERVWDDEYLANSRTLDLHVQRLRKKLGWEKNLVAVYKVGYRLEL